MNVKDMAVKEIVNIYKKSPSKVDKVLIALGQAGGSQAIDEIVKIYKKSPSKVDKVLEALGQAGKNST